MIQIHLKNPFQSANVLVADNGNDAVLADFGLSIRLTAWVHTYFNNTSLITYNTKKTVLKELLNTLINYPSIAYGTSGIRY